MEYKTPYKDLLPPLSTAELEALRASIEQDGVRDPVVVDELGQVLDGHHRLLIAPDAPCRVITGLTEAEKRAYVYQANLARRNLSPEQKQELVKGMRETALALKKEGKTQAQIAAKLGVSQGLVSQWLAKREEDTSNISTNNACIPDCRVKIPPEHEPLIVQRAAAGETQAQIAADYGVSQQRIAQIIRNEQKARQRRPAPPLPEGEFNLVYADPPWQFANSGFEQSAAAIYPTMTTEDICHMPLPRIAPAAVLFLWTPNAMLPDALRVLQAWGFEYKSNLVWCKDRAPGIGWFTTSKHELLLIGMRGTMYPVNKPDSWRYFPRGAHSAKPVEFYEIIESMYPQAVKIELFARHAREGWQVWGNEIT